MIKIIELVFVLVLVSLIGCANSHNYVLLRESNKQTKTVNEKPKKPMVVYDYGAMEPKDDSYLKYEVEALAEGTAKALKIDKSDVIVFNTKDRKNSLSKNPVKSRANKMGAEMILVMSFTNISSFIERGLLF